MLRSMRLIDCTAEVVDPRSSGRYVCDPYCFGSQFNLFAEINHSVSELFAFILMACNLHYRHLFSGIEW